MDPITHCLVGGMVAKTLRSPRRRFWILMFLGEAPDMDVFFGGLGPWAFWLQHRGITHSLLGIVVQTLFYAWIFSRWDRGSFRKRAWHYSIPLTLHLCCDYLTSYGVPLFSPFSFQEFSADLVPAVAVIPLLFMLVGLIQIIRKDKEGWRAVRPLWAAWGLYLVFALSGKAFAFRLAKPSTEPVTVIAGLIDPLEWTAVVKQGSSYTYQPYRINVLKGEKTVDPLVSTSQDNFAIRVSLRAPEARRFVESTRWPAARQIPTGDGWDVEWGGMIFSSRGLVRGHLRVSVTRDGNVKKVERIFDFWSPGEGRV